jgi:hypothetical protein
MSSDRTNKDSCPAKSLVALALAYNQRFKEARLMVDHFVRVAPQHFCTHLGIFLKQAFDGNKERASRLMTTEFRNTAWRNPHYSRSVVAFCALLGDKTAAQDWLEMRLIEVSSIIRFWPNTIPFWVTFERRNG